MAAANLTLSAAGVDSATELGALVAARAEVLALTDATAQAIVSPQVPGGISHGLRAGFACRVARLNGETALAERLAQMVERSGTDEATQVCDPSYCESGDARITAMIRHVDLVTSAPKDATKRDIKRLQDAGIEDADIVRLAEIIAFTNYQVRVIAGLRLLGEAV